MTLEATDALDKKVNWDTTRIKVKADECIDKAAELSAIGINTSSSKFLPELISSILAILFVPVTLAQAVGGLFATKVTDRTEGWVETTTAVSTEVAKKSIHKTIDSSATSAQFTWSSWS